ncbi:MAG: leucine-rich repeat domain-containing protein, partial [Clostridia bacterium]|nr:leucine-rich repeat domain-containing protein [Clostridia bacterium]
MSKTAQYEYSALGWVTDSGNYNEGQFVDFDDENYDENAFAGIDVENTKVNEDTLVGEQIVYTAIYLRTIREYFVTFFNEQILGERQQVLQIKVKYGSDATSLAPTVERDMTVSTVYMFDCWSKDLTCILGDTEVDAKYTDDLRPYTVIYYIDISTDDNVVYAECYRETVKYSKGVQNKPETPESKWTVGFEYKFARWGAGTDETWLSDDEYVRGDTAMYAKYENLRRKYRVTLFDLSMYKLISTAELYYEEKITTIIENDGYDFDAWYRDPDCTDMFNQDTESVDGIMMLFGNTVVSGLERSGNVVTGYHGTLADVILPRYVQGTKMTEVKKEAFADNEVMESIYIPNTYKKVNAYVFKNIKELDIYTEAVNGALLDYPYGWSSYWNNNSVLVGSNDSRTVTNNVENVVTQGDYRYMLVGGGNTAIISKFVNNNSARAYIQSTLDYQNPSFNYVENIDDKTGQKRNVYDISYEPKTYNITTIASSAFSGCENLGSVFIPNTITTVKKYAFSGISVSIYIQHEKKPSGWNNNWSKNRDATLTSDGTGTKDIYWGTIGMDRMGDFSYIFKNDGTAIVSEYHGGASLTTIVIPSYVDYTPNAAEEKTTYTVTELGASLFEASLISLGDVNKITLPENLTKIGKKVFYMNKRIKSIDLPDTITTIDDYAFTGTTNL